MLSKTNGSVIVDDIVIHILQVPYIDGDCYMAVGMTDAQIEDAGGIDNVSLPSDAYYQLCWDIVDPNCEDESNACDWYDVDATLCQ